ncbi:MAG: hypothetical protein ACTHMQ_13990 [Protaetiibacter sp.]
MDSSDDSASATELADAAVALLRARRQPGIVPWFFSVLKSNAAWLTVFATGVLIALAFMLAQDARGFVEDLPGFLARVYWLPIMIIATALLLGSMSYATQRSTGGTRLELSFRAERRQLAISQRAGVGIAVGIGVGSAVLGAIAGAIAQSLIAGAP